MRAFIVVNKINDVFFQDCDTEFTDHINKQAVEQGLLEVNGVPIFFFTGITISFLTFHFM